MAFGYTDTSFTMRSSSSTRFAEVVASVLINGGGWTLDPSFTPTNGLQCSAHVSLSGEVGCYSVLRHPQGGQIVLGYSEGKLGSDAWGDAKTGLSVSGPWMALAPPGKEVLDVSAYTPASPSIFGGFQAIGMFHKTGDDLYFPRNYRSAGYGACQFTSFQIELGNQPPSLRTSLGSTTHPLRIIYDTNSARVCVVWQASSPTAPAIMVWHMGPLLDCSARAPFPAVDAQWGNWCMFVHALNLGVNFYDGMKFSPKTRSYYAQVGHGDSSSKVHNVITTTSTTVQCCQPCGQGIWEPTVYKSNSIEGPPFGAPFSALSVHSRAINPAFCAPGNLAATAKFEVWTGNWGSVIDSRTGGCGYVGQAQIADMCCINAKTAPPVGTAVYFPKVGSLLHVGAGLLVGT